MTFNLIKNFYYACAIKIDTDMAAKDRVKSSAATAVRQNFFVTRESQNVDGKKSDAEKLSYVGMRNLADVEKIDEMDIVSARGTIRGRKNRVRAGLANFENPNALEKLNTERGKVVIYVTSFRGVRSTFEECRYILDLFHNLRVRVVVKDIYMYQYYHKELEERLKHNAATVGHICVPQVFIGGQHIGGKIELEELNEVGELRKILREYPRYETANSCTVCGGFEFIPCRKCGGSKNSTANKFTSEFRALRCTHCNVNGMEGCPACEERRKALEKELENKMSETQILDTRTDDIDEVKDEKESSEQRIAVEEDEEIESNHVTANNARTVEDDEAIITQEEMTDKNTMVMKKDIMREEFKVPHDEGGANDGIEGADIFENIIEHVWTVNPIEDDEDDNTRVISMNDKVIATENAVAVRECGVKERADECDESDTELELNKYISELNDVQF